MSKELDQCTSRAELQEFIERLSNTRPAVYPGAPSLELAAPREQLAQAADSASALSGAVDEATFVAQGVASRISAAAALWDRSRAALRFIDDTVALRAALVAMRDAIDMKDWERAATAADRARALPTSLKTGPFALRMVPSAELPDEPEKTLKDGCEGLAAYFIKQFDLAAAARDTAALTRWFKLLPQVGHRDEGLERYARFVAGIVAGQSRNLLAEASIENQNLYGIAMSRLFESVASILDQHSPLVSRFYGKDSMTQVINVIQTQVDVQGGLIVDTWLDERGIEQLLADVATYQYPGLVTLLGIPTEGTCDIDLGLVGSRLAETNLMLNRWQLYLDFIDQWPGPLETALCTKLDATLRPTFEKLAIFIFRRTVERALLEDELPTPTPYTTDQPLVSPVVDKVTLVLSELVEQALGAGAEPLFDSLLRVMRSDYLRILTLKASAKARFTSYVYLNDLQLSQQYLEKIVERAREQQRCDEALDRLVVKTRQAVHESVGDVLRAQYAAQWVAPVRALCAQCFKGNYLVSPSEPESGRGREFEQGFERMVAPLKESLHPAVYNRYMGMFAQSVARKLEIWILSLHSGVNELGAIALDRDVSRVISAISRTQYSLRDTFAKAAAMVNQIETGRSDEHLLEATEIEMLKAVVV